MSNDKKKRIPVNPRGNARAVNDPFEKPGSAAPVALNPLTEEQRRSFDDVPVNPRPIAPGNPMTPVSLQPMAPETSDAFNDVPAQTRGTEFQPVVQNQEAAIEPRLPSRSERLKSEIDERTNRKFNDKWNFWDTLRGGGIGFLKAFAASNPNQSIGNRLLEAVGGAGMGAVQGTVDPNTDEKWSNEGKLARLYQMYGQEQEFEKDQALRRKQDQEAIKAQFETQGAFLTNQGRQLDNLRNLAKPFYDSIMADDIVTEAEAAEANEKYNLDLKPYDKRQFETQWVNGKPLTAPKLGVPLYARNPTLPNNVLQVPVESTIGDEKFVSTSPQAMTAKVGVLQANAQREQQAAQYQQTQETQEKEREYRSEKEYEDEKRARDNRVRQATADSKKAKARLDSLEATRKTQAEAGFDTTTIDTQIAAAKGDLSAAEVNMQEPVPKKIIRPKVVNPKTSKGGKNNNIGTTDDYQRALQKIRGN